MVFFSFHFFFAKIFNSKMEVKWIITIIKRLSNFSQEISQKYWTDNAERPVESTNNNGLNDDYEQ